MVITKKEKVALIRAVMENYPEAGAGNTMFCLRYDYKNCEYVFIDEETEKGWVVGIKELLEGFDILLELALRGTYYNSTFPDGIMSDICWDGGDTDALVQCAIFGKIIYG